MSEDMLDMPNRSKSGEKVTFVKSSLFRPPWVLDECARACVCVYLSSRVYLSLPDRDWVLFKIHPRTHRHPHQQWHTFLASISLILGSVRFVMLSVHS